MSRSCKPKLSRSTPFPNELIDEAMPRLNDTQWRVLCVVVRQTLGWQDTQTGTRKIRDWLTQSQLKARTGRNAEALAAAIEALVGQGTLVVEDAAGHPLDEPRKRRAYRGRSYYRLADAWLHRIGLPEGSRYLTNVTNSVFRSEARKTEYVSSGKPNTTKEKQTKEKVLPLTNDESVEPFPAKVQEFIASFENTSQECLGIVTDTTVSPGQLASLKRLLRNNAGRDWKPYLQAFFRSDFEYVKQHRYALSAFLNTANVLLLMKPPSVATENSSSALPRNV